MRERERESECEREKETIQSKTINYVSCCVLFCTTLSKIKVKESKQRNRLEWNRTKIWMMCLPFLTLYLPFCMLCTGFTLFKCIWSKASLLLPWCNWKITFDAAHTIYHASSFFLKSSNQFCNTPCVDCTKKFGLVVCLYLFYSYYRHMDGFVMYGFGLCINNRIN